jgi:hypothetical protein
LKTVSNSVSLNGDKEFPGLVFVKVSAPDASGPDNLFHLTFPRGLFAIAEVNIRKSVGSSVRETSPLIVARIISVASGFELDLEIAASGDLSAGPVPRSHGSPQGRFVETSGDVIVGFVKSAF